MTNAPPNNHSPAHLWTLLQRPPEASACQACLGTLAAYVTDQLAGKAYTTLWPEVAEHLDGCVICAEVYDRLYTLEAMALPTTLPLPSLLPAPDLSFLARPPDWTTRLGALIHWAGQSVQIRFLADAFAFPPPQASLSPVWRAPDGGERYQEIIFVWPPDDSLRAPLPLKMTVYRDALQPALSLVEIILEPPDRQWPDRAGIAVALAWPGEGRQMATDAWGLAAFSDVPVERLAELTLTISGL